MYKCIYIYILYVCINVYTYIYICMYKCIYIYILYVCINVYTYIYYMYVYMLFAIDVSVTTRLA